LSKQYAPDNIVVHILYSLGQKVAAGPGKEVEAWLVVANSPATQEVMRFDLIKEPPYIIRLRQEWQGRDWTFEMM